MNIFTEKNNKVYLSGKVVTKADFSHEVYGESFYEMTLAVERLSGQEDKLPITVSERLLKDKNVGVGSVITVAGQFRSYNKLVDGKSKLMLTVFVREILDEAASDNPNGIILCGYVCKPPVYRTTPFNREIADVLLAVNRSYNKSDYIPCIAWGRNARFVRSLPVGEKLAVSGRIQSRDYQKKFSETDIRTLTAYEVSVSKLAAVSEGEENVAEEAFESDFYNLAEKQNMTGEITFKESKIETDIVS
ncbi:MAG TPA: single-stranded DNA-binding protein [Clostridiales bacterium]|nr:single-stranded DNA-binding protein [Clostridiales bacterium]